jgi:Putative DNA-binding domain
MTLLELERKMAGAVMRPLTTRYRMQKKTDNGSSMNAEASAFIKPNKRLSSFQRLEIYNRQYWFRILSAFAEDFPALEATVGKKQFEALAQAYLGENPSRSFTLRNLGSNLESWLSANPQWAGRNHAMAIDVVRLEWAYVEAFDNGEDPALTLADVAQLNLDSLLSLQPHVRLLRLNYPVDDFIIEVHRRQVASSVASNAVTRIGGRSRKRRPDAFLPEEIFLAVHRFDHAVYYKRLQPEAFRLLAGFESGLSLGAGLEKAFEGSTIPEAEQPAHVQQWFASWAELGWFCRQAKARKQLEQEKERRLHAGKPSA